MSSRTYASASPIPIPRNAIATTIEEPSSLQFHRGVLSNARPGLAPRRRQWSGGPIFWIYESSSSSGSSNISSRSEGSEERRARTASPYGSFFVENMEFDVPVESSSPSQESFQERTTGSTDQIGAPYWRPLPSGEGPHRMQLTRSPSPFATNHSTNVRRPGAPPTPSHESTSAMVAERSLSPLSLARVSHHAQPPVSWSQEYPVYPNSPQRSQRALRGAIAVQPGSSISRHDHPRTRGMGHARRRR
jgi:hypothetical protein